MQEIWVRSLGREDSLEKEVVTHSSILSWENRGVYWAIVHRVTKSQTQLSDWTELNWKTIYIMKNLLSLAHILNTQSLWQPKLLPKFTKRSLGWFRNRHMTLHTITVQSEESLELLFDNGEGNGTPLQYSCLGNLIDRGAWQATVHEGHKELDITEWLSLSLSHRHSAVCETSIFTVLA